MVLASLEPQNVGWVNEIFCPLQTNYNVWINWNDLGKLLFFLNLNEGHFGDDSLAKPPCGVISAKVGVVMPIPRGFIQNG